MHLHTVVWACTADAAASALQASQSFGYAMTTTGFEKEDEVYGKSTLKTEHFAGLAVLFHASEGSAPFGRNRITGWRIKGAGRGPRPPSLPGSAAGYDA